jgi:hypothetical protein
MKSVKELPSNIRFVGSDNDPNNVQTQGLGENENNNDQVMNVGNLPEHLRGGEKEEAFPIQFGFLDPSMNMFLQSGKTGVSPVSSEYKEGSGQDHLQGQHVNTGIKTYRDIVQPSEGTTIKNSSIEPDQRHIVKCIIFYILSEKIVIIISRNKI